MKQKFPRAEALKVAEQIRAILAPHTSRIEIAGSIRRKRPEVGDVELLYVPKVSMSPADLFGEESLSVDHAAQAIEAMLAAGVLAKRKDINGRYCWGAKNRLAVHIQSGIPVDLFSTTEPNWYVSLVIRTGGKQTNLQLTTRANLRGYSLEAYGSGYRNVADRELFYAMLSEDDVFRFVGLRCLPPEKRL
jgi:DNA polymerase/3'-5' exonuclease PolX